MYFTQGMPGERSSLSFLATGWSFHYATAHCSHAQAWSAPLMATSEIPQNSLDNGRLRKVFKLGASRTDELSQNGII